MQRRIHTGRFLCFSVLISLVFLPGPDIRIMDNPNRLLFSGFSSALATIGDVNDDSIPDYVAGSYNQAWDGNDHHWRAFVFNGQNGKLLLEFDNPHPQADAAFGFSGAAAGDIDQDGIPDIVVGAFGQGEADSAESIVFGWKDEQCGEHGMRKRVGNGQAFVFSSHDGHLLYSLEAPQLRAGAGFGWSVASVGDLTGDAMPELIVGAHGQAGEGRAFVFNGRDGTMLRTLAPPPVSGAAGFCWVVDSTGGDLNQDGIPDIVVGAPYSTVEGRTVQGRVYIFSGKNGGLLSVIDNPLPQAGAAFGLHVTSAGDLNKDNIPDLLVGGRIRMSAARLHRGWPLPSVGKTAHCS